MQEKAGPVRPLRNRLPRIGAESDGRQSDECISGTTNQGLDFDFDFHGFMRSVAWSAFIHHEPRRRFHQVD